MNDSIEGYKREVVPELSATVEWQRDRVFTATTPRGYDLDFDAATEWGCMPVESLLMSLAGCMAIDVVSILEKMRCRVEGFHMKVSAERRATPPQRLTKARMVIHLDGEGLSDEKVARAVALSEEKYCSVRHSLREDIEVYKGDDHRVRKQLGI